VKTGRSSRWVWRQMSGRVGAVEEAQDSATSNVPGEPSSGIGPTSIMTSSHWPLQSYLELGALPSAVPSARLHARLVVSEWGPKAIADTVELIVSELVTNAVKALRELEHLPPVWVGLSSDGHQVLIVVWDGNEEPIQSSGVSDDELPGLEAEGGRGLLLVDSLSANWGVYWPEGTHGKVVWSVVTAPDAGDMTTEGSRHATQAPLPRRVPSISMMRPVYVRGDLAVLKRVREGLKGLE
jgi:anti-sigma regulatory factor (Ser/Thr protein kinase)